MTKLYSYVLFADRLSKAEFNGAASGPHDIKIPAGAAFHSLLSDNPNLTIDEAREIAKRGGSEREHIHRYLSHKDVQGVEIVFPSWSVTKP